jgi:hypothetical protein
MVACFYQCSCFRTNFGEYRGIIVGAILLYYLDVYYLILDLILITSPVTELAIELARQHSLIHNSFNRELAPYPIPTAARSWFIDSDCIESVIFIRFIFRISPDLRQNGIHRVRPKMSRARWSL